MTDPSPYFCPFCHSSSCFCADDLRLSPSGEVQAKPEPAERRAKLAHENFPPEGVSTGHGHRPLGDPPSPFFCSVDLGGEGLPTAWAVFAPGPAGEILLVASGGEDSLILNGERPG